MTMAVLVFVLLFRDILAFTMGARYVDVAQPETTTTFTFSDDPPAFDALNFEDFLQTLKKNDIPSTMTEIPEITPPSSYVPFDENVTLEASSTDSVTTRADMETSPSISLRNRHGGSFTYELPIQIPVAEFCQNVVYGSYGNPNYGCRIYHVCQDYERYDTLPCPAHLKFSDDLGLCDWPNQVDQDCKTRGSIAPAGIHMRYDPLPITFDYSTPKPVDSFNLDILVGNRYDIVTRSNPTLRSGRKDSEIKSKSRVLRFPHWRQVGTYSPAPNFPRQPFAYVNYPVYLGYKKLRKRLPIASLEETPL